MRRFIVNIIAEQLCAGHSATVMCAYDEQVKVARHRIKNALKDLGAEYEETQLGNLFLFNGARVLFGQLQDYDGESQLRTPLVVIVDAAHSNQVLIPIARAIGCSFPDGKPPILIEC